MSDKSEQMRPIPDGGLKESMPSWLKRPPAWRDLPTVEERHERTLPDPDTSVIDPHSLVDVNDLPQWLQAIAERGELPAPQADVIASAPVHGTEVSVPSEGVASPTPEQATVTSAESQAAAIASAQSAVPVEPTTPASEVPGTGMSSWLMPVALFAILLIAVVLFYVL